MRKILLSWIVCFSMLGFTLAQHTVTGKVVSAEDGNPLPGVAILEQGTTNGTITNLDGDYTLKVSSPNASLVFSFVGMETQTIPIEGKVKIDVTLQPSTVGLEELVVTALGIKRQERALGYAMGSISAKDITKVGSTNVGSALYGKAAGVRISTAPGGATSAVTINIRGINSISFGSQPLIIVDGIPIRNGESNNNGYWGDPRIRGNGLIDINPEDIENVSILKGASASALYGSEAGNGVVLITTKSGRGGQKGLGVDFNMTYTAEKVAFTPKYQNEYGPGYDHWTNMGAFGADEEGWLRINSTGTFRAPLASPDAAEVDAYLQQPAVSWDASTDKLGLIGTQKWLNTGISQMPQTWAELRRLNKPVLQFMVDASSDQPNPPVRFVLPDTEKKLNSENYKAVQSSDNLTTKVFWDVD